MAVLERLIWQIETDLKSDIALPSLARRCAVNLHHMCRVFQFATGMSIMAYVRARRLSVAAKAIAFGTDGIITIALDTGYGSHGAFTRAFASYFGTTPSSLRSERSIATLDVMEPFEMNKDMIVPIAPPRIEERAAFRVVGLGLDCAFDKTGEIPALWASFMEREGEVQNPVPGPVYGVCCTGDGTGNFRYIAGIEATGSTPGMEHIDMPTQNYAVFTHSGHISDLGKTVYTIWNKALPDAGLESANAPDFERYDYRFDGRTGRGELEIWVPIAS